MKIGVVGLGNMGLGIAKNLLGKGYEVYGYDIDPARGAMLAEAGGQEAAHCAALGAEVKTAVLMVFSPDNLRDVLLGEKGLMETLPSGSTVVVTASVGPDIIAEVEPKLAEKGVAILDAPLMADVNDALEGTMHMIVAGGEETVAQCRGLLEDMSQELYFVGDRAGMGQAAKMCLQTLFSLTFESAFEVITLGKKLGLNLEEMHRLYQNCPSSSVLFHITESNILNRVFTDTFNPLSILDKDIHLALGMAEKLSIPLPASQGTASVFREAMRQYAQEDIWAAVKIIEAGK